MTEHVVKWFSAAPLWSTVDMAGLEAGFARPALLRFATDSFMDEYLAALERDPARIRTLAVRHETWRTPINDAPVANIAERTERPAARPLALSRLRLATERRAGRQALPAIGAQTEATYKLKLYQPIHQRYYLVAATLACELAGLPDRTVDPGNQERVSFVLRRLFPKPGEADKPDDRLPLYDPAVERGDDPAKRRWEEYAYVPEAKAGRWQHLADPDAALPDEERLPLFPSTYSELGRKRRIFAGLAPTGRREVYMAAPRIAAGSPVPERATPQGEDPRLVLLQSSILEPWKALIARAETVRAADQANPQLEDTNPQDPPAVRFKESRGDVQLNSWLLLVDWIDWLKNVDGALADIRIDKYDRVGPVGDLVRALQAVKTTVVDDIAPAAGGGQPASAYRATAPRDLAQAIKAMDAYLTEETGNLEKLEGHTLGFTFPDARAATRDTKWPPFLFLFADAEASKHALPPEQAGRTPRGETDVERWQGRVDFLFAPAALALGIKPDQSLPASAAALQAAPDMREGWFVIRCIYERPECGPLHPAVVSAPTDAFQIAGFFDPDAPARPIRIGLPIDTTPAGLRKFDRKTMFMVSNILCGQIDRLKGLSLGDLVRHILPFPLHKKISVPERGPCEANNASLGMMCSLSIPIVTICALILLMIIVSLLDFIFKWLPYLVFCLPIPGFKGKRQELAP